MVREAERGVQVPFAFTDQVTEPLPLPLAGEQVSQVGALLEAVQVQVGSVAVTVMVPLTAGEPTLAVNGPMEKLQIGVTPACVTANVCPAMFRLAEREVVLVLAA